MNPAPAWSSIRPDQATIDVDLDEALAAAPQLRARRVARAAAELGEHPAWSPRLGKLVWVDIMGGLVLATGDDDRTEVIFRGPAPVGAALPVGGDLLVVAADGVRRLDPLTGAAAYWGPATAPGFRYNDAGLDPAGRLWAGTLSLDDGDQPAPGEVLLIDGETSSPLLSGLGCPNGIVWNAAGDTVLVCESDTRTIAAADAAQPDHWRTAWRFHGGGEAVPDGLEWLPDGRLWVAFWGLGAALRFTPDGRADLALRTDDECTTSICTAPDGTWWVTSADGLHHAWPALGSAAR
jgi:Gluconolactonase